jgi:hypothetical protein
MAENAIGSPIPNEKVGDSGIAICYEGAVPDEGGCTGSSATAGSRS